MNYNQEYGRLKAITESIIDGGAARLVSPSAVLVEAMRYALTSGGKRIRPVLFLAAYGLGGAGLTEPVKKLCFAIEALHTYTLVHDDLPCMDDDDERRGRPSCHIAFGEAHALLAGDALLNLAAEYALAAVAEACAIRPAAEQSPVAEYSTIQPATEQSSVAHYSTIQSAAEQPPVEQARGVLAAARYFFEQTGLNGVIGGQSKEFEGGTRTPEETLDIARHKTAALFKAALVCGGLCADLDAAAVDALKDCGHNFGMFFQLKDDINDMDKGSFARFGLSNAKTLMTEYKDKAICAAGKAGFEFLRQMINSMD